MCSLWSLFFGIMNCLTSFPKYFYSSLTYEDLPPQGKTEEEKEAGVVNFIDVSIYSAI